MGLDPKLVEDYSATLEAGEVTLGLYTVAKEGAIVVTSHDPESGVMNLVLDPRDAEWLAEQLNEAADFIRQKGV